MQLSATPAIPRSRFFSLCWVRGSVRAGFEFSLTLGGILKPLRLKDESVVQMVVVNMLVTISNTESTHHQCRLIQYLLCMYFHKTPAVLRRLWLRLLL